MAKVDILKTCGTVEGKDDHVITPKGRSVFLALARPFKKKDAPSDQKGQFIASLLFPPDADLTLLKKVTNEAGRKKFHKNFDVDDKKTLKWTSKGKVRPLTSPFLDPTEATIPQVLDKDGDEVDLEGWTLIRANTKLSKIVVRSAKGAIIDPDDLEIEAYTGRWLRIEVQPWAYTTDENDGVKLTLMAAQLLTNDKPLGGYGAASDGESFEAVDDEDDVDVGV